MAPAVQYEGLIYSICGVCMSFKKLSLIGFTFLLAACGRPSEKQVSVVSHNDRFRAVHSGYENSQTSLGDVMGKEWRLAGFEWVAHEPQSGDAHSDVTSATANLEYVVRMDSVGTDGELRANLKPSSPEFAGCYQAYREQVLAKVAEENKPTTGRAFATIFTLGFSELAISPQKMKEAEFLRDDFNDLQLAWDGKTLSQTGSAETGGFEAPFPRKARVLKVSGDELVLVAPDLKPPTYWGTSWNPRKNTVAYWVYRFKRQ